MLSKGISWTRETGHIHFLGMLHVAHVLHWNEIRTTEGGSSHKLITWNLNHQKFFVNAHNGLQLLLIIYSKLPSVEFYDVPAHFISSHLALSVQQISYNHLNVAEETETHQN